MQVHRLLFASLVCICLGLTLLNVVIAAPAAPKITRSALGKHAVHHHEAAHGGHKCVRSTSSGEETFSRAERAAIKEAEELEQMAAAGGPQARSSSSTGCSDFHITLNFELMENSTYSCFSVGQKVILGTADFNGNTFCDLSGASGATTSDCIHTCREEDILTDAKKVQIRDLANEAKTFFEGTLRVNSSLANIVVSSRDCQLATIPSVNVSNTNFVVFVMATPTPLDVLGIASFCAVEATSKRPIVSTMTIGTNELARDDNKQIDVRAVAIHELTHALGFTLTGFKSIIGSANLPRVNDPLYNNAAVQLDKLDAIYAPKTAAAVRDYFGCQSSSLPDSSFYLPLENQGGAGTMGSHWEQRVFRNEYMTGSIGSETPVYSPFTLLMLEDMGWYCVKTPYTNNLVWGKQLGCNFLTSKCNTWETSIANGLSSPRKQRFEGYKNQFYCSVAGTSTPRGCIFDGTAIGDCTIKEWTGIPSPMQYFSSSTQGGSLQLMDFCPSHTEFKGTRCTNTQTFQPLIDGIGSTAGATSRCFHGTVDPEEGLQGNVAACLRSACSTDSDPKLAIFIEKDNAWRECKESASGRYEANSQSGLWRDLECPWPELACSPALQESSKLSLLSVTPSIGPAYGGHTVTLSVQNFVYTSDTSSSSGWNIKMFGTSTSERFDKAVSPSSLEARTVSLSPAVSSGTKPIQIEVQDSIGRSFTLPNAYTIDAEWPRIDSFNPPKGASQGGETVTILGNFFPTSESASIELSFGDDKTSKVKVLDAKQMTVVLPKQSGRSSFESEQVEVTANIDGKYVISFSDFEYTCNADCLTGRVLRQYWWAVFLACLTVFFFMMYLSWRCIVRRQFLNRSGGGKRKKAKKAVKMEKAAQNTPLANGPASSTDNSV